MAQVTLSTNNMTRTVEVNQLLSRLQSLEDTTEGAQRVNIPLYPRIERINRKASGDLEYTFSVKFPRRPFLVTTGRLAIPNGLRNCFNNNGEIYLKEERGVRFKYEMDSTTTAFNVDRLKFDGKHIFPNIYNSSKLCFGSQETTRRQGTQYILEDVNNAITQFLGSTFNNDLSSVSGNTSDRKRDLLALIERKATGNERQRLIGICNSLSSDDLKKIYVYWAFASLLDVSLSEMQAIL